MPQADTYTFTGLGPLGYYSYVDTATGQMLIAQTGESYGIRAVEPDLFAVPPPDGRWTAVTPAQSSLPDFSPPPAKPAVTVPAAPEGVSA